MSDFNLLDYVSVETLQELQDDFSNITGMAALMTDVNGSPITEGSNFTTFCMELVRKSGKGCKRCEQCDKLGGETTGRTGKAAAYFCHAGLMDFAAPITHGTDFIGSFIGGQVLTEKPDEEKIRAIAKDIDIDPDELWAAIQKVNVVPKEQVEKAAKLLHTISKIISSTAYAVYKNDQLIHQLDESIDKTNDFIHEVKNMSDHTLQSVKELDTRFHEVFEISEKCKDEVESCGDIVADIQDNAMTTHILGLNASIEAARAKEEGKSFQVIASEVRNLADISRRSADVIQEKMVNIGDNTAEMSTSCVTAKDIVGKCADEIARLNSTIDDLLRVNRHY